jgi:putative endonuclease
LAGLYPYIANCADASYYTGVTNDLDVRDWLHNHGNDTQAYTYSRRPVKTVFTDFFPNPVEAIAAEKQIKGWTRKKKEALIAGRFDLLKGLSSCLNRTSHKNYGRPPFDPVASKTGVAQGDLRETHL